MKLPEFLEARGISADDFLERNIDYEPNATYTKAPAVYIDAALTWKCQPEGYEFWNECHASWKTQPDKERWLELECRMGWIDPVEYELSMVRE